MEEVNQPVPPAQTPDQMHSSFEEPHNSKVIPFIIIAVLLILVGVGSYVLGTKKNQPAVESKVTPQPSPTLTSTTTPDPTANWQTYSNNTFGYSVMYPETWKSLIGAKGAGQVILMPADEEFPYEPTYVVITVIESLIQPLIGDDMRNKKSLQINGINGEQGEFEGSGGGSRYIQTAVANNGKTYYINLYTLEYKSIYDQILSTLKFTP